MREFVIRRLRRAPIIEPLWDEYERMQAMLQTALAERDTAQATREAALAERDAAQAAREAALAERDAAQAAREGALAELDAAQAAQEATLCLYRQALCSTSLPLQTDSVTVLRQILERTRPRITVAITNDDPNEVTRVSNLLHTARLHGLLIIIYGQGPAPEQVEIDTLKRIEIIHPGIDQSQRLESLVHNGPVEPLFVALNAGPYAPELIVLPNLDKFQIAVAAYSKILSRQGSELPAFMVMTDDLDFELLALREPVGFEKIISNLTAEVFANLIYFSDKRSTGCWALYGIMAATCNYDDAVFSIEGYSLSNVRTRPTILLYRSLLGNVEIRAKSKTLLVQYDDAAQRNLKSVAYGRRRGWLDVDLIPDPFFFQTKGFETIRNAVSEGKLPLWEMRQRIVFWRGSPTTNMSTVDGTLVTQLEQVPRIAMCLALKDVPNTDVAMMSAWEPILDHHLQLEPGSTLEWLRQNGIFRPGIPMLDHASYRFLIDIDGVANAWSFFEKLLLGACVLKVQSPFEQWFYSEIEEWRHFVPVKHNLSDLIEKIEWCQQHEAETFAIAERGQRFALQYTFEDGWEAALRVVKCSLIL